jgi:hypothetical protein
MILNVNTADPDLTNNVYRARGLPSLILVQGTYNNIIKRIDQAYRNSQFD